MFKVTASGFTTVVNPIPPKGVVSKRKTLFYSNDAGGQFVLSATLLDLSLDNGYMLIYDTNLAQVFNVTAEVLSMTPTTKLAISDITILNSTIYVLDAV